MGEENQSDFNQNYTNGQELDTQDTAAEDIPLETATDKMILILANKPQEKVQ
jgi:hypothetical protein